MFLLCLVIKCSEILEEHLTTTQCRNKSALSFPAGSTSKEELQISYKNQWGGIQ